MHVFRILLSLAVKMVYLFTDFSKFVLDRWNIIYFVVENSIETCSIDKEEFFSAFNGVFCGKIIFIVADMPVGNMEINLFSAQSIVQIGDVFHASGNKQIAFFTVIDIL